MAGDALDFKWTMAPSRLSAAEQLHYGVVLARSVGIDETLLQRALATAQVRPAEAAGRWRGGVVAAEPAVGRQQPGSAAPLCC